MIDGYAYALIIDGAEIKAWITGQDGALRDVNLRRFVAQHESTNGVRVQSAQIVDQRVRKVVLQYPVRGFATDGERIFGAGLDI